MTNERNFELEDGITGTIREVSKDDKTETLKITYLDEVEYSCFGLFKQYASIAGVEFDKENIDGDEDYCDFSIAKDISEHIISLVESTFKVSFPVTSKK